MRTSLPLFVLVGMTFGLLCKAAGLGGLATFLVCFLVGCLLCFVLDPIKREEKS